MKSKNNNYIYFVLFVIFAVVLIRIVVFQKQPQPHPLEGYGTKYYVDMFINIEEAEKNNNRWLSSVPEEYSNLIAELQRINPSFNPNNYIITVNEAYDNGGIIKLRYYISHTIRTSSVYLMFVDNNHIEYISDRCMNELMTPNYESNIIKKMNDFLEKNPEEKLYKKVDDLYNKDFYNLHEVNGYFFYDYDEEELYYILDYTLQSKEMEDILSAEEYRIRIE